MSPSLILLERLAAFSLPPSMLIFQLAAAGLGLPLICVIAFEPLAGAKLVTHPDGVALDSAACSTAASVVSAPLGESVTEQTSNADVPLLMINASGLSTPDWKSLSATHCAAPLGLGGGP